MEQTQNISVLLLAAIPLAAALLGYLVRRWQAAAAYLAIAALLSSAVLCAVLLRTPFESNDNGPELPHQFTLGAIALPAEATVRRIESQVPPEARIEYAYSVGPFLAENRAQQPLPVKLAAGPSQLLFAATTALIAALCLLFALWERRDNLRRGQFFATLTLFSGAMLLFICADTLLLIYLAWELMGLCGLLLIAHPGTERARRAAREAFWTTRATDFGLLLAVIILMGRFGWMSLSDINPGDVQHQVMQVAQASGADFGTLMRGEVLPWFTAAALLILLAVVGKTALLPLSFWLAEAMVAPPPVSALLHAATMVAAGPFLLIQLESLLIASQPALVALTLVAGASAVLCGAMALCARDAKRVLAYSTVSQLSIPLLGMAVFAGGPALYHLIAHAWYKAPLFLVVGYLAVSASRHRGGAAHVAQHSGDPEGSDDHTLLTRLGGSGRRQPLALATLLLAGAALAGLAFTGGYFGKEQILHALMLRGGQSFQEGVTFGEFLQLPAAAWHVGSILLLLSIPLTAAYTARLVGILGWGRAPASQLAESPASSGPVRWVLVGPLLAALAGSIGLALAFRDFKDQFSITGQPWRWTESDNPAMQAVLAVDLLLVLGGIFFAILLNVARPAAGAQVVTAGRLGPLIDFFASGMRLREFWLTLIGRGGALLAQLADRGEFRLDRALVNTGRDGRRLAQASAWFERHVAEGLRYWGAEVWWVVRHWHRRLLQTGSIQHYMLVVLLSAVLLSFIILRPLARAFREILARM